MALTASEVLNKLEGLRQRLQRAQASEAVARSQYDQAQKTVQAAEAELRALGIDPANAEQRLTEELAKLDQEIDACDVQITAALDTYQKIGEAFNKLTQTRA